MARPREFDEQRVLNAAMEVFWEKGYESTSMSELTTRMGIQRPSLYAAFGDKRALFDKVLHKYTEQALTYFGSRLAAAPTAIDAVSWFFAHMLEEGYGDRPYFGCLCINTMAEMSLHDLDLSAFTLRYQQSLTALFRERIERGIQAREFNRPIDADAVANLITVTASGLAITLKSRPERAGIEKSVSQLLQLMQ